MENQRVAHTCEYFLRMIRSGLGLDSSPLPEKPDDVAWKDLFRLSDRHSVAAITFRALKNLSAPPDPETFAAWEKAYGICIHADVQQLYAWEEIRDTFTAEGFRLLPLKGLKMKALYPESALRLMGDLDILYEKSRFSDLKKGMEALGYRFRPESAGSNHQIFFRPPVTDVEMHSGLLPVSSPYVDYYADPWSRALPTEEKGVFRFSTEDEYIFLLIHACKHFRGAGGGVRTAVDFYLFRKKYARAMDAGYVDKQLSLAESFGAKNGEAEHSLHDFEKELCDLSARWLEGDICLRETDYKIFSDGVYGKVENIWAKESLKKGRARYLAGRLFPPFKMMKTLFPVLSKLPVLLPFCWLIRIFRAIFCRRKQIAREYRFVRDHQETAGKTKNDN